LINNRQANRRRGRGGQRPQTSGRGIDNGNRIDSRARGNAPQMLEKYKTLARDAQQAGDRVLTEYYLQFADHYFRVVSETRNRADENQAQRRQAGDGQIDDGDDGDEGEDVSEEDDFGFRLPVRQSQPQAQPRDDRNDRPANDRQANDRQSYDRQQNDRYQGDRPSGARQQGDRQQSDRQPADRQTPDRQGFGRDAGARDGGARDSGYRDQGARDQGARDQGSRDVAREQGGREQEGRRPRGNGNAADEPRPYDAADEGRHSRQDGEERITTSAPLPNGFAPTPGVEGEPVVRRRGRPPRAAAAAAAAAADGDGRLDSGVLPPSFAPGDAAAEGAGDAPAPRRRGRPRKSEGEPAASDG